LHGITGGDWWRGATIYELYVQSFADGNGDGLGDLAGVRARLPYLAGLLGAKPPLRAPAWVGRLLAGELVAAQMTSVRGSSNLKAKKELGWEPRYGSWKEGFHAWISG